jgi:hypothetical protein
MSKPLQSIGRVENPSAREFYELYVKPNRPVVITGATSDWKAIKNWSPEYFRSHYPDARVIFTSWDNSSTNDPTAYYRDRKRRAITIGEFVASMDNKPVHRTTFHSSLSLANFPNYKMTLGRSIPI